MSATKQKEKTAVYEYVKEPKVYYCVIHNDNITTMDFVVMAIVEVFGKTSYEAAKIMTQIHHQGSGAIGSFCLDIAVSKKHQMDALAKQYNFPLKTTVEEAKNL